MAAEVASQIATPAIPEDAKGATPPVVASEPPRRALRDRATLKAPTAFQAGASVST